METILSCRLVLNLRRLSRSSPNGNIASFSTPDELLTTNGILGNIGEPLRSADEGRIDHEKELMLCDCNDGVCPSTIQITEFEDKEDSYWDISRVHYIS